MDVKAACKGVPLAVFFDYEKDYTNDLAHARSYCDTCPMRAPCLATAMDAEGNDADVYRAGVFGGLTPQQRHSLHKRGIDLAGEDPLLLRQGILRNGKMKPIPDRGDQWTERHTKLARMALDHLTHTVEHGAEAPDALSLSRTLKVGVKDLRRVYQAFREDRILKRSAGTGALTLNRTAAIDYWLPKHLRKQR